MTSARGYALVRMARRRTTGASAIGLALALAAGCGGSPDATKFDQTWAQDYADTDCEEWSSDMTEQQRFVMAADFLYSYQKRDKADVGLPSDADVGRYTAVLDTLCDDTGATLADEDRDMETIAALAYLPGDFKP